MRPVPSRRCAHPSDCGSPLSTSPFATEAPSVPHRARDGQAPRLASGDQRCGYSSGSTPAAPFGEAALQVRGAAGEHQVDGAKRALGHAYGGGSQFFALWVVGSEKPTS